MLNPHLEPSTATPTYIIDFTDPMYPFTSLHLIRFSCLNSQIFLVDCMEKLIQSDKESAAGEIFLNLEFQNKFGGQYVNSHLEKITPTYKLNPLLVFENSQPPALRHILKMSQPPQQPGGGRNYVLFCQMCHF